MNVPRQFNPRAGLTTGVLKGHVENVSFRILLPGWKSCGSATLDGAKVKFRTEKMEDSVYVTFDATIQGVRELVINR